MHFNTIEGHLPSRAVNFHGREMDQFPIWTFWSFLASPFFPLETGRNFKQKVTEKKIRVRSRCDLDSVCRKFQFHVWGAFGRRRRISHKRFHAHSITCARWQIEVRRLTADTLHFVRWLKSRLRPTFASLAQIDILNRVAIRHAQTSERRLEDSRGALLAIENKQNAIWRGSLCARRSKSSRFIHTASHA